MSPHISTLKLNQYRYGELDDTVSAEVRAHVDACDRCARRLQVQQAAREDFVLQPVPAALLDAAAPGPANNTRWFRMLAPALIAAAALFLVMPAIRTAFEAPQTEDRIRLKGLLPELEVWVGTDAGPRPVRDGEVLQPGDRVQLLYNPRGAALVTLAGRDGAGVTEVYKTFAPDERGLQPAPFALTLDDAAGPQEFWVITSEEPLSQQEILDRIEARVNDDSARSVSVPKE